MLVPHHHCHFLFFKEEGKKNKQKTRMKKKKTFFISGFFNSLLWKTEFFLGDVCLENISFQCFNLVEFVWKGGR
jgi:hypothetical protein